MRTRNIVYVLINTEHNNKSLIGKLGSDFFIIQYSDILYIEADGNDCVCVTKDNKYYIKEKIYQIEGILYEYRFLRVSRSHVINMSMIKSITPTQNMKFKLTMNNDSLVHVTRSYYFIFKDYLGI